MNVTLAEVEAAAARLAPHLTPTPLVQHPAFARALGVDAWLKLETVQPTGAFKVRGGINWMSVNAESVCAKGVVSASTGNHGQSIAYAAQLFGVPATIYAPLGANPFKVGAMEAMGARVRLEGDDFQAAVAAARTAAAREGFVFVSSGDEPLLIAGVATCALEALRAKAFDVALVPVGGGSNAAGAALVARAVQPACRVIAVGSASAPAAHDAWRERRHVAYETQSTLAEGLATRESYDLPQALLAQHLDDFVSVADDDLVQAMRYLMEHAHQLAEPAAVAGLAYLLTHRGEFTGGRVLLPITGANIAYADLVRHLGPGAVTLPA